MKRRTFLESTVAAAGMVAGRALRAGSTPLEGQRQGGRSLAVDPTPLFELSPYLYMQFMEPLGDVSSRRR